MDLHFILLGILFSWSAAMLDALGNVLFKYETVYPMKSRWCLNWHRVGMMLVLGGACMAIGSMSLLPITMGSAGSALPIVFGEIWSGWLLPHTQLNKQQWLIIAFIVLSVTGVVISGDHRPPHNVADDFVDSLDSKEASYWIYLNVILCLFTGIIVLKSEIPSTGLKTCSLLNILGPIFPGSVGAFTQICLRIGSSAIFCTIRPNCYPHLTDEYYALIILVPCFALLQLNAVGYVMGRLVLTTSIPVYQSSLIILPALSGIFVLGERPSHMIGYIASLSCTLIGLAVFVTLTSRIENRMTQEDSILLSDRFPKEDSYVGLDNNQSVYPLK